MAVHLVSPQECLGAVVALPAVSILIVGLRFFTRYWRGSRYGADDWLTIPALVLLFGMGAALIVCEVAGRRPFGASTTNNLNGSELNSDQSAGNSTFPHMILSINSLHSGAKHSNLADVYFEIAAKCIWAFQMLMYPVAVFTKLSLLCFYRRVFWPQAYPRLGKATLITGAIIVLWSLVFLFLTIFDCGTSVGLNWAPLPIYEEACFGHRRITLPYAATDLVLNVVLLILPLPTIYALQLNLRRQIAIGGMILLGSTAIVASVVRLVLLVQVMKISVSSSHTENLVDITWYITRLWKTTMYWSIIETGLALQTACLPVLCSLLPARALGYCETGRTGSLVTQMGNNNNNNRAILARGQGHEEGAVRGSGLPGAYDGDLEQAEGTQRSSGWFARFRELSRDRSMISELDLAHDGNNEQRGRTRFRAGEEEQHFGKT